MSQQSLSGLKTNLPPISAKVPEPKVATPVAAIAIPAGEHELLIRLIRQLPVSLGLSYLVLEYPLATAGKEALDESSLRTLLEKETLMPVVIPDDGALLERDRIYLLPAATPTTFEKGRVFFSFSPGFYKEPQGPDQLFAAVSAGFQDCSVAIFASDDTGSALLGLRTIRDEGGLTIALADAHSSHHLAAIGPHVDIVLPAAEAATQLKLLANYLRPELRRHEEACDERIAVSAACRLVQQKKGADLTRFAGKDILRRIHRRMGVRTLETLSAYIACIQADEDELTRLYAGHSCP